MAFSVTAYLFSYVCLATRWRLLLGRSTVGFWKLYAITAVHNALNAILPGRIGELSYIYLLRRFHIVVEQSFATLVFARLCDMVMLSFFILVSLASAWQRMGQVAVGLVEYIFLVFIIGTLLLVGLVWLLSRLRGGTSESASGSLVVRLWRRVGHNMIQAMAEIPRGWGYAWLGCTSVGVFLCRCLMVYGIFLAMGYPVRFLPLLFACNLALLVASMPVPSIAAAGSLEVGWLLGFTAVGVDRSTAIASALIFHAIWLVCFAVAGACGYLALCLPALWMRHRSAGEA